MLLEKLKWTEVREYGERVFIVPLGSMEQHGLHLPLGTDFAIIAEIARRIEERAGDSLVVTPPVWLGHSPHHRRFSCVSLDLRPYMELISGVCRSLLEAGARRILLLNGHGGNDVPCRAALRELKSHFQDRPDVYLVYAAYWNLAAGEFSRIRSSPRGGMGHACEMETSVMLRVHPDLVDTARAEPGGPYDQGRFRVTDMLASQPYYIVNDFDELSVNGAIGMPQYASPEKGEAFLNAAVNAAVEFARELAAWNYQEAAAKRRPS